MQKQERDVVIEKKLQEITDKKEILNKKVKELPEFRTNLRLKLGNEASVVILRVIQSKEKLIWILGDLISLRDKWASAIKLCGDIKQDTEANVSGYKISDWIEDVKVLINKIDLEEEIEKLNKVIDGLPKFYSDDKKDDIEFEKLLSQIG